MQQQRLLRQYVNASCTDSLRLPFARMHDSDFSPTGLAVKNDGLSSTQLSALWSSRVLLCLASVLNGGGCYISSSVVQQKGNRIMVQAGVSCYGLAGTHLLSPRRPGSVAVLPGSVIL
jgi:hypothetical protein